MRKKIMKFAAIAIALITIICIAIFCILNWLYSEKSVNAVDVLNIPEYSGVAYVEVNGNKPFFTESDISTDSFEYYSKLDSLGRCGVAFANISREMMTTEERGEIGSIKPSGWNQAKYEGIVDSKPPYLYNICKECDMFRLYLA